MASKKRTTEQRKRDLAYISNLFVQSYGVVEITSRFNAYLDEIGEDYQLSYKQITYDCKQLLEQWKKQSYNNIDDYVRKDLQKLDRMEQELWEAWENSKGTKTRVRIKEGLFLENLKQIGKQSESITMSGDPRYFDLILQVMRERAKMLGYNKPDQIVLIDKIDRTKEAILNKVPDKVLKALSDSLLDIGQRDN